MSRTRPEGEARRRWEQRAWAAVILRSEGAVLHRPGSARRLCVPCGTATSNSSSAGQLISMIGTQLQTIAQSWPGFRGLSASKNCGVQIYGEVAIATGIVSSVRDKR